MHAWFIRSLSHYTDANECHILQPEPNSTSQRVLIQPTPSLRYVCIRKICKLPMQRVVVVVIVVALRVAFAYAFRERLVRESLRRSTRETFSVGNERATRNGDSTQRNNLITYIYRFTYHMYFYSVKLN